MRLDLSVLTLCLSTLCLACPGAESDEGTDADTGESEESEESEESGGSETGGDYCLDVVDLEPNFEISGVAPSGLLNFGGTCVLSTADFDEGTGLAQLSFSCSEGGAPFELGIAISDLSAAPAGFSPGAELDLFVFREAVIVVETDPDEWFDIKSNGLTLAAGHKRAHGSRGIGPITVEAMTDCEIIEDEPEPQGYIMVTSGDEELRVEVGEVAQVSAGAITYELHARQAIPSCCLGYESSVTIVQQ